MSRPAKDRQKVRQNKAALITGASRGIGRGIALELARIGFDLIINFASNESAAKQAAEDCRVAAKKAGHNVRAEVCQGDISKGTNRRNLIQFVKGKFGRLDLLVNNAGIAPEVRADILDATEESFDRLINVNVKGPYFLTQLAAKYMLESSSDFGPRIITITSVSSYTASINRGDYCISKAALSMITPLFAARLASSGINVYEIRPGIIETDMTKGVLEKYGKMIGDGLTPIERLGKPSDVGKAVVAIAQDLLPFSTGEVINVDGGFHLRRL